jgi:hypothetical protein
MLAKKCFNKLNRFLSFGKENKNFTLAAKFNLEIYGSLF